MNKWWIKIFIGSYNPTKEIEKDEFIDYVFSRIIETSNKNYLNAKEILKFKYGQLEFNQLKEEKEKLKYKKCVLENYKLDNSIAINISMCGAGVSIIALMFMIFNSVHQFNIYNFLDKVFVWGFMISCFVLLYLLIRITLKGVYKLPTVAKEIAFCALCLEVIEELLENKGK